MTPQLLFYFLCKCWFSLISTSVCVESGNFLGSLPHVAFELCSQRVLGSPSISSGAVHLCNCAILALPEPLAASILQVGVTSREEAVAAATAGADALLIKEEYLTALLKSGKSVQAFLDDLCTEFLDV